jgi:carboxylate-amine ligase
MGSGIPTVGIEEEYFVVDAESRRIVPEAAAVIRAARAVLGERVTTEIARYYLEARTEPDRELGALGDQVRRMRAVVAQAAEAAGLRVVASGTPVLGEVIPLALSPGSRYERQGSVYQGLVDEQAICACHVHVHVPDREQAVAVSNRLRPWLPVLVALAANSPFWAERDTGYASWRTVHWGRWPVAGPPPYFASLLDYEKVVEVLLENGTLTDAGTIFWDIRLSAHLPTLEVRVADVPVTAEETVLLSGVVRALVMTALGDIDRGLPAPRPARELLRAAYWRAARDGLEGNGIDPLSGRLMPAAELVRRLLGHIGTALAASGDLDEIATGLHAWLERGSGAARQRRSFARRGQLTDVVDDLVGVTAGRRRRA